jgi:lipopolysaccharide export system permease protein
MISKLHSDWLKEFVKFFCIIQMLVLALFILIDYLSRMDKFLNSDLTLVGALGYVLLKVPFMFIQMTPASILLACITVFALMNRNNELLAIRSSGISIYYLIRPALFSGGVLAILMFFLGETIVPISMAKANYIEHVVLRKNTHQLVSGRKDIWIKSDNRLIRINYFDPVHQTVSGITISTLGEGFRLEHRLDAQKGVFSQGEWILENVVEQTLSRASSDYDVQQYEKRVIEAVIEPEDLGNIAKKSDEMSYYELKGYVAKVESEGYNAVTYKVDLNGKMAFPFICVIMVLTGAATGMRGFAKENLPVAIAIGVVIAFVYWIMYGLCLSLGYGSILPPVLSAWIANLFFFCAGLLYLVNTE